MINVMQGIPSLTALLTLAAMMLGISVATQVVQELYKFMSNSKARAFKTALIDFLGSWSEQLFEDGPTARLHVRGPFQFFKSRPGGVLLPMEKKELLEAMDTTLDSWLRYTLAILKEQQRLQAQCGPGSRPVPRSESFKTLLRSLADCDERAPGSASARRVHQFFINYGISVADSSKGDLPSPEESEVDAGVLLQAFYQEFFPERVAAEEHFPQLKRNFDYAYERRNLRQTLVFAFMIAVVFNLPFDELYMQATKMPADQALKLADTAVELYGRSRAIEGQPEQTAAPSNAGAQATSETKPSPNAPGGGSRMLDAEELQRRQDEILKFLETLRSEVAAPTGAEAPSYYSRGFERLKDFWGLPANRTGALISYVFSCLVTAIFVSFGAPFWDRLTTSLLSRARSGSASRTPVES